MDTVLERQDNTRAQARRVLLERELARWLPLLIAHERPDKIILFGSYCTGQIGERSDLDVVIIKETTAPFLDRARQALELLKPRVGGGCAGIHAARVRLALPRARLFEAGDSSQGQGNL
jgi:predicted nucleotidyltransferase